MAEDITQDVAAFNFTVWTPSNASCGELEKRFRGIVEIHLDAKQYERESIQCDFKIKYMTFLIQMRQEIQPNCQVFSSFVFLMDNVGYMQHASDTSIRIS